MGNSRTHCILSFLTIVSTSSGSLLQGVFETLRHIISERRYSELCVSDCVGQLRKEQQQRGESFIVNDNYTRYSYSFPTTPLSPVTVISVPTLALTDVITGYANCGPQCEAR